MPIAPPRQSPMSAETSPTVSDVLAPKTTRESMSRPRPSVPSRCSMSGAMRRLSMSMSVGLCSGSRSASTAAASVMVSQASASHMMMPRRRRRTGAAMAISRLPSSATMTDPRIEHRVEDVDGEIDQHEPGGDEQHHPLQDDEVARIDGADQQPAD